MLQKTRKTRQRVIMIRVWAFMSRMHSNGHREVKKVKQLILSITQKIPASHIKKENYHLTFQRR